MKNLNELHIDKGWESFLAFRERRLQGIQTGIKSIDRALLGLGGITVIQGAPGCNKSTLALQIAHHNATLGNPALIIDRENGRERFRMRLICQANRVSQNDVLCAPREQLREWVEKIRHLPIYVCTENIRTYEELSGALGELSQKYGRPMLMVVDSLQALPLIDVDERMSLQAWLKHFDQAKLDYEGKLTTIITSEKRRGTYDDASLDGAKGAGAIEYKAEMILDMRRDGQHGLRLEVKKHRDGEAGLSLPLNLVLADSTNDQSFCFKLAGVEPL